MMAVLALLFSIGGFACLALAMERHHRQLLNRALWAERRRLLRLAGGSGVAASYACTVAQVGWGIGTVAWFGFLSLGAAAVLLTISARENAK